MAEHCGTWLNQLPRVGVEVKSSNVGERESRKFYEGNARTDGAVECGSSTGPEQSDGSRVDAILHECG